MHSINNLLRILGIIIECTKVTGRTALERRKHMLDNLELRGFLRHVSNDKLLEPEDVALYAERARKKLVEVSEDIETSGIRYIL